MSVKSIAETRQTSSATLQVSTTGPDAAALRTFRLILARSDVAVVDLTDADVVLEAHERPGKPARDAVSDTREQIGELPLVVALREITLRAVHEMIDAGANAVIWTDAAAGTLTPALQAADAGLVSFPAELRERFARPALSAREKQVLALVVMGFSNAEIGAKLHIAQTTVKTHLASIFSKLGVRSRNEAVTLVLDPVQGRGLGVLSITKEPARV